jgi:hypothetical protein
LEGCEERLLESYAAKNDKQMLSEYRSYQKRKFAEIEEQKGKFACEIAIMYQTKTDVLNRVYTDSVFPFFANQTVEDGIQAWQQQVPENDDRLSDKSFKRLMKILAATCFFAVDKHELVLPDVPRELITIKRTKRKGQAISEQRRVERELAKCRGWVVGREIDLPRPLIHYVDDRPSATHTFELKYGHIRSGHMRMQPCGAHNQDRKLIFVAPTIVRPDLLIRRSHGYRIHDKVLR